MEITDEELTNDKTEDAEDEDVQLIDPNDLIIIDDPDNFIPTNEMILAYATLLGYNPAEDPKEILDISERYLRCKLPDDISRAFMRTDFRILYINMVTQEITLESDLEPKAKEEFEICREKYKNQNKPPIKTMNIEEELKKKLNEQKQFNDSLKFGDNIQIVDNEEEEEEDKMGVKVSPPLNNSLNQDKNKDKEENTTKEDKKDNKIDENNIINSNNSNKKVEKEEKDEYEDDFDDYFNESSKSSNKDKDIQKTFKSNKFEEEPEVKKEKKEDKKEEKINNININNIKIEENLNYEQKTPIKEDKKKSNKNYQNDINNSSEEEIFNNRNKKNKITKKDESNDKRDYLSKIKSSFTEYKNKLKQDYLNTKNDFLLKNEDKITSKIKKKKTLELSQDNLDDIDIYESSLKQRMEQELNKYKKNLISSYENNELNPNSERETDLKQKLELKKLRLESDIRIQKERNKNTKENEEKKNKNLIENKKINLEEKLENKKSRLTIKHKNDINNLEKEFQNNYEKYINEYKNKDLFNKDDITSSTNNDIYKSDLKELEEEFIKELKEQFEQEKITINYELETKLMKEIETIKHQLKNNNEQEIKKINENINNLGTDYFNEIDRIKKKLETQKKKDDSFIYEKIEKISNTFLNELKNKNLKKINEEMEQIITTIKQNVSFNDDNEIKIEEYLIDKFALNNSKLNEKKSIYDLIEKEYNDIVMSIKFLSKAISIMNKTIIEKGSDISFDTIFEKKSENKDDLMVGEIILNLQNELDEFKLKNKDNISNKIYPFLEEEIKNLIDNIKKLKERNIIRNNAYSYFNTRKANLNYNNNYDDFYNSQSNNNYNFFSFPKQEKKTTKSFSQNKNNINYKPITRITETSSEFENGSKITSTGNNIDINNLELSNEIIDSFPEDILILYNKIISFIKEESSSIEKENQKLNNNENMNNSLKNLKDSDNFGKYKNDINYILSQEQRSTRNNRTNYENKKRHFIKIKSFWEETLYSIYNNYSRTDIIKKKLNILVGNINDYKATYYYKNNENDNFNVKVFSNNLNNLRSNNNLNVISFNEPFSKNKFNNRYGGSSFRNFSFDKKFN